MQSSQSNPNRDRVLRIGCHCAQCSPYLVRSGYGEKIKLYHGPSRIQHRSKHGRSKPRGIHAYRRGIAA